MVTISETPPAVKEPVIEFKDVTKSFVTKAHGHSDVVQVLDKFNLRLENHETGEFLAVLGPSGSGKSTLLNMLAGLLQPDSGEVLTHGRQVTSLNDDTVTVQQAYTCFPWLTALGNVEFGLKIKGASSAEATEKAKSYLEKVGLGDRLHAYPKQMSGGMQQRVALARALAVKPSILLMDEPFGALDAQIRAEMQSLLLSLWSEEKNTVFFITHDITEALMLADRIIVLSTRPAKIVQDLAVPFLRPRPTSLVYEDNFVRLSQNILQLLKNHPGEGGQVRVTV